MFLIADENSSGDFIPIAFSIDAEAAINFAKEYIVRNVYRKVHVLQVPHIQHYPHDNICLSIWDNINGLV